MQKVDVKTGYQCNNNCYFCAQAHNKRHGNRSIDEIKGALRESAKDNVRSVVFTGGEFTVRKDCLEIVRFAKSIGFTEIQIQTNGRTLSNDAFVKALISAGVTEFSPAIHGYLPEIHDYLTRSPGSWEQVVRGIKNVKANGARIVVNSVVVKPNYRYVPELSELLVSLGVEQYQFAFVHSVGNTSIYFDKMMPFVSLAEPFIKKGLQIGIDAGCLVMAEAMPYCVMQGFERYVSELYIPPTNIFEGKSIRKDFEIIRKTQGKTLFPQCRTCRFRIICEGPWKEYPEHRGSLEFKPVPGKLIESTDEIFENEEEFAKNPEKSFGKLVFENDFRTKYHK